MERANAMIVTDGLDLSKRRDLSKRKDLAKRGDRSKRGGHSKQAAQNGYAPIDLESHAI
jgi:hypothetical protein